MAEPVRIGHHVGVKICPACSREYGNEHATCPTDGVGLVLLDTSTSDRAQDLIGKIVDGRYRVERIVGRGGMGTVYACRHVVVGKTFAMKVLRSNIERSEEILQRFIREAQAANAIGSRHICEMTDFGQLPNGAFYVVMELLDGDSLSRALRDQQLDREQIRGVFIQIAETLDKAHRQGIVHRDLKPDNVVLVRDDNDPHFVKLVDFGIAKMMQSQASNLTETGVILGTPYYMSPEQARGDPLDHRSDIYALGVMMYRAFTGRLPFIADTAMGVLTRHLTEQPELPSRIADLDGVTERLIMRCLEKQPIDRFQSMEEVAAALRYIGSLDQHAAAAPPMSMPTRVDTPAPHYVSGQMPAMHPHAASGSNPAYAGSGPYAAHGPPGHAHGEYPAQGHPAVSGAMPAVSYTGPPTPAGRAPQPSHAAPYGQDGQGYTQAYAPETAPAPYPSGGYPAAPQSPGQSHPNLVDGVPRDLLPETFTNRGLVSPPRVEGGGREGKRKVMWLGAAVVLVAAGAAGAVLALGTGGSGAAAGADTSAAAPGADTAPPATTDAPTAPTASAAAEPTSSAVASPTSSAHAGPAGTQHGSQPWRAPTTSQPPPPPSDRPPPEIRSPFD